VSEVRESGSCKSRRHPRRRRLRSLFPKRGITRPWAEWSSYHAFEKAAPWANELINHRLAPTCQFSRLMIRTVGLIMRSVTARTGEATPFLRPGHAHHVQSASCVTSRGASVSARARLTQLRYERSIRSSFRSSAGHASAPPAPCVTVSACRCAVSIIRGSIGTSSPPPACART
jgi:hypothetical protein